MSPRSQGEIRRSQLITTYGVGSIVALADESFMIAGIDRWAIDPTLHEPRLERELNLTALAVPPATENGPDVPIVRFPTWVSCPVCNRLNEHRFFASFDRNVCGTCDAALVPSRFIAACANGHADDFPYFKWVHKGSPPTGAAHALRLIAAGSSAALGDITISCDCGIAMTMEGAFGRFSLRDITACSGRRPWLTTAEVGCVELPRVLLRGASNVWFGIVRSALSIPPWSDGAFQVLGKRWSILRHVPGEALAATLTSMRVAEGTEYTVDDLIQAIAEWKRYQGGPPPEASLRDAEYEALLRGRSETSAKQQFVCVATPVLSLIHISEPTRPY